MRPDKFAPDWPLLAIVAAALAAAVLVAAIGRVANVALDDLAVMVGVALSTVTLAGIAFRKRP